jgi:hypothetical protein
MNFESKSKPLCALNAICHIIEIQREIRKNVILAPTRRGESQNFAGFDAALTGLSPVTSASRWARPTEPSDSWPGIGTGSAGHGSTGPAHPVRPASLALTGDDPRSPARALFRKYKSINGLTYPSATARLSRVGSRKNKRRRISSRWKSR